MQIDFDIDRFKPFLGRLVIKTIGTEQSVQNYLRKQAGLKEDSVLVLPETMSEKSRVPITTGEIVIIGDKSFGERFEKWYGKDCAEEGKTLKVGDIVQFVETQVNKLDLDGNYYEINDEQILGYIRVNSKEKEEEVK